MRIVRQTRALGLAHMYRPDIQYLHCPDPLHEAPRAACVGILERQGYDLVTGSSPVFLCLLKVTFFLHVQVLLSFTAVSLCNTGQDGGNKLERECLRC